jgi:hypothetical protein
MDSSRGDELEKIVGRVKDVILARVVRDGEGKVKEVRVLTGDSKSAQRLARDVTSAVRSQGEDIAQDAIHVAQMTDDDWDRLVGCRLRLEGVSFGAQRGMAEAHVTLLSGSRAVTGADTGPRTSCEALKIVARATIAAIRAFIDPCPDLSLEGTAMVEIAGIKTVVVLVSATGPDGFECFSGSCPVRMDDKDAAARATLNAINRKFALMVKGTG